MFFVISGFLITQVLVRELDRTGGISLTRFFAGRVKRLMPQVLTAIAAVVAVVVAPAVPVRADAVASDVMAAGVYAMNWRLSESAVDYFAAGDADRPLDHFWSLAVEEQFYFAWPLLLLAVAWLCRRRAPGRHGPLVAVLGIVAVASFAHAIDRAAAVPEQAYFSAATRAWELAAGGLLAVALLERRLGTRARARPRHGPAPGRSPRRTLLLDAGAAMPGAPALLPVLGAVALLAAGTSADAVAADARADASAPARFVGRISYAWYVWHWPVLVFAAAGLGPAVRDGGARRHTGLARARARHAPLDRGAAAALEGAPAPAAGDPGRGDRRPGRRRALRRRAVGRRSRRPWRCPASEAEGAGQLARTGAIQESATALRPRPVDASDDRGKPYRDGCLVSERETRSPRCVYGARRPLATVVLFGDSHAMQLFPALEHVALRRRWRLVEPDQGGLPAVDRPRRLAVVAPALPGMRRLAGARAAPDRARGAPGAGAGRRLRAPPRARRLAKRLGDEAGLRTLANGWRPVLRRLRATADHVVVAADPPRAPLDVPACVSEHLEGAAPVRVRPRPRVGRGAGGERDRCARSGASACSTRRTCSASRTSARA